jgi:hypothetical protein
MVNVQSNHYNIPWAILNGYTKKFLEDPERTSMAKIEKPFVTRPDTEIKILNLQGLASV